MKWIGERQAARRWTRRDKPSYIEAYPRISIGAVLREARRGHTHLLWRDRRELVVGAAWVESISESSLLLHYAADDLPYADEVAGNLVVELVWKASQEHNQRGFGCCPECPLHVDVLVLKDRSWACTGCHRLQHRSALLREEVRWSERLAELTAEIGSGRPWGMREPVFAARSSERDDLLRRLGGKTVTANALYLTRIHTEWVPTPVLLMSPVP